MDGTYAVGIRTSAAYLYNLVYDHSSVCPVRFKSPTLGK